jgi:hypothetical protein
MQHNAEVSKDTRFETPRSNVTRYVRTLGVNAVTIYNQKPYFFLFADIDTKEPELLRKTLGVYKRRNLTAYWWETNKGYNIASPCLLGLRSWMRTVTYMQSFLDYSFDTIRISRRATDGKILYGEQWNKGQYVESYSLIYELLVRFCCNIRHWKPFYHYTTLEKIYYNQLLLRKCQ